MLTSRWRFCAGTSKPNASGISTKGANSIAGPLMSAALHVGSSNPSLPANSKPNVGDFDRAAAVR